MVLVDYFRQKPDVPGFKSRQDVPGLIKALQYKKDPDVRLAAASALGRIGDAIAIDALIGALKDSFIRWEAALALERIGEPAVEPLTQTLDGGGDTYFRNAVQKVLQRINQS